MTEMLLTLGCIAVCTEADPRDFFFTACTHAGPRIVKLIHCVILYSKKFYTEHWIHFSPSPSLSPV